MVSVIPRFAFKETEAKKGLVMCSVSPHGPPTTGSVVRSPVQKAFLVDLIILFFEKPSLEMNSPSWM